MLDPPLREVILESFQTRRSVPSRQLDLNLETGTQRVAVATLATPDSSTNGVAVVAVVVDMTAVAKLDDNLRRLNQLASIGTLGDSAPAPCGPPGTLSDITSRLQTCTR